MKRISLVFCLVFAATVGVRAQSPVTVKSSPAADALIELSKSATADKLSFDQKVNQARGELDATQKTLSDDLQATSKTLTDQVKSDKRYKPLFEKLADLQKKLSDAQANANTILQKDIAPLQSKLQTETAQVDGLIKVVKKENGLPDDASYDVSTQKWTVPVKK